MAKQRKRYLDARFSGYDRFMDQMITKSKHFTFSDGPYKGKNPLRNTDTTQPHHVLHGIFSAWSAVLEVLTFYQDRIQQEGYLSTAEEVFSRQQLLRMLGAKPQFALAATTHLAFTLLTKTEKTQFVIPKGTQAQNIPKDGKPAIFETVEDFVGSPDWNQLTPYLEASGLRTPALHSHACFGRVMSPKAAMKPGDRLLITGMINEQKIQCFTTLTHAEKQKDGTVLIAWEDAIDPAQDAMVEQLLLVSFGKPYALLGHDAAHWETLPIAKRMKLTTSISGIGTLAADASSVTPMTSEDAPSDITAMTMMPSGAVVAVGKSGLQLADNLTGPWKITTEKMLRCPLFCVLRYENMLYVGGSRGAVFCSSDQGEHWQKISGKRPLTKKDRKYHNPGMLPSADVLSIAIQDVSFIFGSPRHILYCGTAKGIFYSLDDGVFWNEGSSLFDYDEHPMPKDAAIYHIDVQKGLVTLSTSKGLYHAQITRQTVPRTKDTTISSLAPRIITRLIHLFEGKKKRAIAKENAHTEVYRSVQLDQKGSVTIFSTNRGLYRLEKGRWTACDLGLLRDEKYDLPRVYDFMLHGDQLFAATNMGIYVSQNSGNLWQLCSSETLYTLPALEDWTDAFENRKFPEAFKQLLQSHGFALPDSAGISALTPKQKWQVDVAGAAPITIDYQHDQLTLCFGQKDSKSVTELIIASPQVIAEKVEDGSTAPDVLTAFFAHCGVLLGAKNVVQWNEVHKAWHVIDHDYQAHYLVANQKDGLTLSRIYSAKTLCQGSDGAIIYAGDSQPNPCNQWPDWNLPSQSLPLAHKLSKPEHGSPLVIEQTAPWLVTQSDSIASSTTEKLTCCGKMADTTLLHTATAIMPMFQRNQTSVYVDGKALTLAKESFSSYEPITAQTLALNEIRKMLPAGNVISVEGRRAVLQLGTCPLVNPDQLPQQPVRLYGIDANNDSIVLSRKYIFSFKAAPSLVASCNQTILPFEVYSFFQKNHIILAQDVSMVPCATGCWMLVQPDREDYVLCLDVKTQTIEVYREYYFPLLKETEQEWHVVSHGKMLRIAKQKQLGIRYLAADDSIDTTSEIAAVENCMADGQGHISLTLTEPLTQLYDPTTIVVRGNVVPATHGESVRQEVLGSSESGKAFQSFPLRRAPLTVYEDAQGKQHYSLTVKLRRSSPWEKQHAAYDPWQEVTSLLGSPANAHVYQLVKKADDVIAVMFGDGHHGAVPHQGTENIVVDYRCGGGERGNLPAGAIRLLRSKPRGVKSVVNPVPALGGEDITHHPHNDTVPQIADFDVLISPQDCLAYAQQFPGVIQATQSILRAGSDDMIALCIQARSHDEKEKQALCTELKQAIIARLSQTISVDVVLVHPVNFSMQATVFVDDIGVWDRTKKRLEECLLHHYGRGVYPIGAAIEASQVITCLQEDAAVSGVELSALSFNIHHPVTTRLETLEADQLSYDNQKKMLVAAEVLVVRPQDITLKLGNIS
jgi:hypothetical protein